MAAAASLGAEEGVPIGASGSESGGAVRRTAQQLRTVVTSRRGGGSETSLNEDGGGQPSLSRRAMDAEAARGGFVLRSKSDEMPHRRRSLVERTGMKSFVQVWLTTAWVIVTLMYGTLVVMCTCMDSGRNLCMYVRFTIRVLELGRGTNDYFSPSLGGAESYGNSASREG